MYIIQERFNAKEFPGNVRQICDSILSNGVGGDVNETDREVIHETVYAIDGNTTMVCDDAIGYDEATSMVQVHITDVARVFGNNIDNVAVKEALQRCTSVYGAIYEESMFPEEFSTRVLSLTGDRHDGTAITTQFGIDENGDLRPDSFKVYLTRLENVSKLTYAEGDTMIHSGGNVLAKLCEMAELRGKRRREIGEVKDIRQSEVEIRAVRMEGNANTWQISFDDVPSTGSTEMVAELMISANYVFCAMMDYWRVPIPYRCQDNFHYPDEDMILELSPHYRYRAFRHAKAAQYSLYGYGHCGLGLDMYCTMTSPARKSVDLFCQFQFKVGVLKDTVFDDEYVENVMDSYADMNRKVKSFIKEQRRMLTLTHFKDNPGLQVECIFMKSVPWLMAVKIDEGEVCMNAQVKATKYDFDMNVYIRVDDNARKMVFPCMFKVEVQGLDEVEKSVIAKPVRLSGPPIMTITAETYTDDTSAPSDSNTDSLDSDPSSGIVYEALSTPPSSEEGDVSVYKTGNTTWAPTGSVQGVGGVRQSARLLGKNRK